MSLMTMTAPRPRLLARLLTATGNVRAAASAFVTSLIAALVLLLPQAFTHASVTIDFDVNVLFAQVNDWINVFLPILGIGISIAIALALITFVGSKIVGAFKGGF